MRYTGLQPVRARRFCTDRGILTRRRTAETPAAASRIEAAVVRFTAGGTTVDVTIGPDSRAVRDFLNMLPLTLSFEEFAGHEKISYLPRKLDTTGTPGSDPEDGDLIYYVPWGNLGFYYNAAGTGPSDDVIHIGKYAATAAQLEQLETGEVTVELVG
jgi:hypothetical protein